MTTLVIPGQPLPDAAMFSPGSGCFSRGGKIYASILGEVVKEGGNIMVRGKEDQQAIPEPNSIVRFQFVNTVIAITRGEAN
jgi:exosome complex component CSL4